MNIGFVNMVPDPDFPELYATESGMQEASERLTFDDLSITGSPEGPIAPPAIPWWLILLAIGGGLYLSSR